MPAKQTKKSDKMTPIEFINWELSKEEKTAAKSYQVDADKAVSMLEGMVEDGYRISFKRDYYNKCVNCSFTEPAPAGAAVSRCIVSRGPTLADAIRVALFKHFVILEGDWGNISPATLTEDVWG